MYIDGRRFVVFFEGRVWDYKRGRDEGGEGGYWINFGYVDKGDVWEREREGGALKYSPTFLDCIW